MEQVFQPHEHTGFTVMEWETLETLKQGTDGCCVAADLKQQGDRNVGAEVRLGGCAGNGLGEGGVQHSPPAELRVG